MRNIVIAIALSFFALAALVGVTAEPAGTSAVAAATFPNGDPVIVNLDTSKPFAREHRDGIVTAPPTRRFTDI
jgi:hypothetical protein